METTLLLNTLKQADQDFEWYPTTREMITVAKTRIPKHANSIMDIGAGDGRVLAMLAEQCEHVNLYSIEIASLLAQAQPPEIIPVGTDFWEQNLASLPVDYIFCNPPYSQYEEWTCKIIEEGHAKKAILIIPQRWKESKAIETTRKQRGAEISTLFEGDFLHAERQARAKIEIIEIRYPLTQWGRQEVEDPFSIWFDNNIDTFEKAKEQAAEETSVDLARRYAHASIPEMVAAYREEYNRLEANYRAIFRLDYEILRELGINKANVRDGLKLKIKGLKNKYWHILFNKLDAITSRLATSSKNKLLEKLTRNAVVEFTETNAYAIVLWAIKNANLYFDDQLIALFFDLSTFEGVENYKSNQRTWKRDGWRYNRRDEKHTHYKLDYRIVISRYTAIFPGGYDSYRYPGNLSENSHALLADIIAVFANLGFRNFSQSSYNRTWKSGKVQEFCTVDGEVLFQVRAYLNGNMHIKFAPEAIKALNIEAGRLLKWVRGKDEVISEMGYTEADAEKYFQANHYLLPSNVKLLN